MKKFMMYLSLFALLAIPAGSAFAWDIGYLNPLPYIGIGQNRTQFSLNPFTGFKNCNPCRQKVEKCNKCAVAEPIRCSSCQRAFLEEVPAGDCDTHYYYYMRH